jgi:dTDP-4-dehydrorhamnose 3,5-epimerase
MQAIPLDIPGCYLLQGIRPEDARGDFFKLFHAPTLAALGLETHFPESYLSTSRRGVIRGMHFQTPPADHAKLVCCVTGRARDGLVDLRKGSPTFGKSCTLILSQDAPDVLYVPRGVAHGFAAHEDDTRMWYLVSSVHAPAMDAGIRFDSVGINWWADGPRIIEPVLSVRDRDFPALQDFPTPFVYGRRQ